MTLNIKMCQKVFEGVWFPLTQPPEESGKYLVGHAGTQKTNYYFTNDREWAPGTKMGWFEDPEKINATHWMKLPECPRI